MRDTNELGMRPTGKSECSKGIIYIGSFSRNTFIYSDLKIIGIPNSLLLNTKTEDVIFLFAKNNEELDIPLNKMINEEYKIDYIQPITK